jgi:hypothetical protein
MNRLPVDVADVATTTPVLAYADTNTDNVTAVVTLAPAAAPKAVFPPVVQLVSALRPTAVLNVPVVLLTALQNRCPGCCRRC